MQGRIKFFNMLLRQVERCGIPVHWGQRVKEYYETETAGGVVLYNGEKREADIVIAAGECQERYMTKPIASAFGVLMTISYRWYQIAIGQSYRWLYGRATGQRPVHLPLRIFPKVH